MTSMLVFFFRCFSKVWQREKETVVSLNGVCVCLCVFVCVCVCVSVENCVKPRIQTHKHTRAGFLSHALFLEAQINHSHLVCEMEDVLCLLDFIPWRFPRRVLSAKTERECVCGGGGGGEGNTNRHTHIHKEKHEAH